MLLTVVHRRLPTRGMMVGVSTGWHAHLDMLAARLADEETEPFWDRFGRREPKTSGAFRSDGRRLNQQEDTMHNQVVSRDEWLTARLGPLKEERS